MQHINEAGLKLVEEEEAFIPFVYDDFVEPRTAADFDREWKGGQVKGTLTIGFGTTAPPSRLRQGTRVDRATAAQWLREDLADAEASVERLVKVPLNDNQFSTLSSFVYNVGEETFAKSTLLRLLNGGNYDAVPRELNRFVNSKGVRLKGLVRRRAREGALWSTPAAPAEGIATEVDAETPIATAAADPIPDKTPASSKTLLSVSGGFGGLLLSVVGAMSDFRVVAVVGAVIIAGAFLLIGRERIQKFFDDAVLAKREPA